MSNINLHDIKWEEPRPAMVGNPNFTGSSRQSKIRDFCEVLRLRPGQWAKFPELNKAGYSNSLLRDMGINDIEFVTRVEYTDNGEKKVATYGRALTGDELVNRKAS